MQIGLCEVLHACPRTTQNVSHQAPARLTAIFSVSLCTVRRTSAKLLPRVLQAPGARHVTAIGSAGPARWSDLHCNVTTQRAVSYNPATRQRQFDQIHRWTFQSRGLHELTSKRGRGAHLAHGGDDISTDTPISRLLQQATPVSEISCDDVLTDYDITHRELVETFGLQPRHLRAFTQQRSLTGIFPYEVCVCVYVFARLLVYLHAYMYTYLGQRLVFVSMCTCVRAHAGVFVFQLVYEFACVRVCVCVCVCVCVHMSVSLCRVRARSFARSANLSCLSLCFSISLSHTHTHIYCHI